VATSRESELQAIADRFADAAGEDIREALARSVGRFTDEHPGLDGERLAAFGAATERAIAAAADEISARLRASTCGRRRAFGSPRSRSSTRAADRA
jgi:hypothetical protein